MTKADVTNLTIEQARVKIEDWWHIAKKMPAGLQQASLRNKIIPMDEDELRLLYEYSYSAGVDKRLIARWLEVLYPGSRFEVS